MVLALKGTMLRFSEKLREALADKAFDTANIAAGALIFGQALGDEPFSTWLAFLGLGVWFGFMAVGVVLLRGQQ